MSAEAASAAEPDAEFIRLRDELREALSSYSDPLNKVQRAYFDRQSFAFSDKHDVEYEIKRHVSERHGIPFRSVVFTGSAQLGISPHKGTIFKPGESDLDIACVDPRLYARVWRIVIGATQRFRDLSAFHSLEHAERTRNHILKGGMILLDFMPTCAEKTDELRYMDNLSRSYRHVFGRISLAVYMSEFAFCQKQISSLESVFGV